MNAFVRSHAFDKLPHLWRAAGKPCLFALAILALVCPLQAQAADAFQDIFTNRQTITSSSGRLIGDNTGATFEIGEPNHGGKPGGHSLWISWVAPADGVATFFTDNNAFDTLLSAYFLNPADTTVDKLHEAARDDDNFGSGEASQIQFGARAGQHYEIAVDGFRGATGAFRLRWDFVNATSSPPIIVSTPNDQAIQIGVDVTLTVDMITSPDVQLRWFHNEIELTEEKSNTLTLTNLQPADIGTYRLRITIGASGGPIRYWTTPTEIQINSEGDIAALARNKLLDAPDSELLGEDGGGHSLLRMLKAVPKAAGSIGVVRGYNGSQIFDTTYATVDATEPAHCGVAGGASYWLAYQPPTNGTITLDTAGSTYDTVMEAYTYNGSLTTYADLISVACDNDAIAPHGASRISFPVVKSRQYFIVVDGVSGARGTAWLNYTLDTGRPPTAPSLVSPPAATLAAVGTPVMLAANLNGCPPLGFSWRKNETPIAGATMAAMFFPRVSPADSADYVLTVTNDLGTLTATLPLRVVIAPACTLISTSNGIRVSCATVSGQRYTLEEAKTPSGPWLPQTNSYGGDGKLLSIDLNLADTAFFRLRVE